MRSGPARSPEPAPPGGRGGAALFSPPRGPGPARLLVLCGLLLNFVLEEAGTGLLGLSRMVRANF